MLSKTIFCFVAVIAAGVAAFFFTPLGNRFVSIASVIESSHETGASDSGRHSHHGENDGHSGAEHSHRHKLVVTSSAVRDVTVTQQYVCQIHSRRHIDVKAIEGGYLESIKVREGQSVRKGELMFHILPTIYSAKLEADLAEAQLAQVEFDNTEKLVEQNIVSDQELKLARARLEKARAKVKLAKAELDFADIRAPFDGIIDRLHEQEGSLIEEGDMLTTMSDNHVMWVYFNVPEARYIDYQRALTSGDSQDDLTIELKLANHETFEHRGQIGAIEADFNSETGNIPFRADFPNPDRLLRHGQTGNVLIHRVEKDAVVIPQRATYEILAKKYAYVVDEEDVVHQREIHIKNELEDIFVIDKGLEPGERIVFEGIRQVRDGDKIEFEYVEPIEVLSDLKHHAE